MKNNVMTLFAILVASLAVLLAGEVNAASMIPTGTLTALGTDLTDTFSEGIAWAYPIMLTFTGGVIAFSLVKSMIKRAGKA